MHFGVSTRQLQRIWKRAKTNFANPNINAFQATPQKKGNSGRPRVYNPDNLRAAIAAVPLTQKQSLCKLAAALDMSMSTLFYLMGHGNKEDDPILCPHTSALKPLLLEVHELASMMFACSRLDCTSGLFDDCLQEVHVDKKWFYLTEDQLHL
jgi:hypothetical protein